MSELSALSVFDWVIVVVVWLGWMALGVTGAVLLHKHMKDAYGEAVANEPLSTAICFALVLLGPYGLLIGGFNWYMGRR